jgi:type II secretion system (T2SS) protein E
MYLAHLEKLARVRIEDVLVEEGILDRARVEDAQAEQEKTGRQLSEILFQREIISDYDFAKLVVTHYSLAFLDVTNYSTRRDVLDLLPNEWCLQHAILPLDQFGSTLTLAVCEVPSPELLEEIATRTNLAPFLFAAVRSRIVEVLETEKKRGPRRTKVGVSKEDLHPAVEVTLVEAPPTTEEIPLPDLELPLVSLKLLNVPTKAPPAPARQRTAPEPQTVPIAMSKAALSWMDTAARMKFFPDAKKSDVGTAKVDKFGGGTPPVLRETVGGTKLSNASPGGQPAAEDEPEDAPIPQAKGKKWQSIFEMGETAVKKEKSS